ncbi:MAG: hypothetical protein AAGA44_01035 [Pseudomonadota bacterium]
MRALLQTLVITLIVAGVALPADAADEAPPRPAHELVELRDLLDAVSKAEGKDFLVDRRVQASVVIGTLSLRDVDYAAFLSILRNNDLAAVDGKDIVRVIPVAYVRQSPLPILRDSDSSLPADAWVARILMLKNTAAPPMVPILRPMVPQQGHLVATADTLLIVAPYGVTEQLAEIAQTLDVASRD